MTVTSTDTTFPTVSYSALRQTNENRFYGNIESITHQSKLTRRQRSKVLLQIIYSLLMENRNLCVVFLALFAENVKH